MLLSLSLRVCLSIYLSDFHFLPLFPKSVSQDVKDNLKDGAVIVSFVSAIPVIKLKQIFDYDQILKPEFYWEVSCFIVSLVLSVLEKE